MTGSGTGSGVGRWALGITRNEMQALKVFWSGQMFGYFMMGSTSMPS